MSRIEDLIDRVERLLLRHDELQRTNVLLQQQLLAVSNERDSLRARLSAARLRIDTLIDKLPAPLNATEPTDAPDDQTPDCSMKQFEVSIMAQIYLLGCP